jgi:hypothetical protein
MGLKFIGGGSDRGQKIDPAPLQQLRGYWEALRREGDLPARARIDPRGIAAALEHAFLIERIAPGLGRFRLCGMHLHDLVGMELVGMPLSVLFEPDARKRLSDVVEQVFASPAALEIWLEGATGLGRPALSARMLMLPLRDAAGEVTLAIGGLVSGGTIGRQPRRFAIARHLVEPVPVSANPAPAPVVPPAAMHLAEAPARFIPQNRTRAHLRLVYSRD